MEILNNVEIIREALKDFLLSFNKRIPLSSSDKVNFVFEDNTGVNEFTPLYLVGTFHILTRYDEDDYGILLSVSGQEKSVYGNDLAESGMVYLIADISRGDGTIIREMEEVYLKDEEHLNDVIIKIKSFFEKNKDIIVASIESYD